VNHSAVRRALVVDLDFVSLIDRDLWIAARFIGNGRRRETNEDP
jgi:hypothetical protein